MQRLISQNRDPPNYHLTIKWYIHTATYQISTELLWRGGGVEEDYYWCVEDEDPVEAGSWGVLHTDIGHPLAKRSLAAVQKSFSKAVCECQIWI